MTISHFFGFWSKFSHDLKREWQQQQKRIAKRWASSVRRDKSMISKKPVVTGGLVRTSTVIKPQATCINSTPAVLFMAQTFHEFVEK